MPEEDEPEYLTVVYETSSADVQEASGHDGTGGAGTIGGAADSPVEDPPGSGDGTSTDGTSGGRQHNVTVYTPGIIVDSGEHYITYQFTANVDGRTGYVHITVNDRWGSTDEATAADGARRALEGRPDLLEGFV